MRENCSPSCGSHGSRKFFFPECAGAKISPAPWSLRPTTGFFLRSSLNVRKENSRGFSPNETLIPPCLNISYEGQLGLHKSRN